MTSTRRHAARSTFTSTLSRKVMVMRLVMEDYSGAGPVITEYAIRQCRRASAALRAPAGAPSGSVAGGQDGRKRAPARPVGPAHPLKPRADTGLAKSVYYPLLKFVRDYT